MWMCKRYFILKYYCFGVVEKGSQRVKESLWFHCGFAQRCSSSNQVLKERKKNKIILLMHLTREPRLG